ncbi:hypothetical protein [Sphingobacterium sp.]|uniref:hypothetical protein n=1 Tax=Sphingobacterium sp. TaxID=341027 RepID=UPI002FDE6186
MKDLINKIDEKYYSYLNNEGKWLGGTLATVFKNKDYTEFKKEVFINLPHYIQEDLKKIISER